MTEAGAPEVELARRLHSVLHLDGIEFAAIHASLSDWAPSVSFGYSMTLERVLWDRQGDHITAVFGVSVTLQVKTSEDGDSLDIGTVRVAVRSGYRITDELTPDREEAVPAFLGLAGWMHAWPYLRAEVQTLTTKLALPALTLPLLLAGQTVKVPVQKAPTKAPLASGQGAPPSESRSD